MHFRGLVNHHHLHQCVTLYSTKLSIMTTTTVECMQFRFLPSHACTYQCNIHLSLGLAELGLTQLSSTSATLLHCSTMHSTRHCQTHTHTQMYTAHNKIELFLTCFVPSSSVVVVVITSPRHSSLCSFFATFPLLLRSAFNLLHWKIRKTWR